MRTRSIAVVLGLLAMTTGCSTIEVHSDWDREVEFSRYGTYRWAPTPKAAAEDRTVRLSLVGDRPLFDRRVRRAVDEELAARGLALREEGAADLLLVYHASARKRIDVYDYPYRRRWGWGVDAHETREGTLILEMIDRSRNEMVWQGWGVGALGDPESSEERIREIVAKILERYPPE
jgi:hypothetical protein